MDFADIIKFASQSFESSDFIPTSRRKSKGDSKCAKALMHSCWLEDGAFHVPKNEGGL